MASEQDFIRLMLDHPKQDEPRLSFADWLEEQGDRDRAEFIRVQCSRARLRFDDTAHEQLAIRESEFLLAHEKAWTAPILSAGLRPRHVREDSQTLRFQESDIDWRFERGVIERLDLGQAAMPQVDQLLAILPFVSAPQSR